MALVETSTYTYLVEEINIQGFEIFQDFKTKEHKSSLSHLARPFIPSNQVHVCKASEIDLKLVKPGRAGVIVSTIYNGIRYFGFGIDWKTSEITDFGGGAAYTKTNFAKNQVRKKNRRRRTDTDVIHAALRECREESFSEHVFGPLWDKVDISTAIYNSKMLILIIPLVICPFISSLIFNSIVVTKKKHEIRQIYWMNEELLKSKLKYNVPTMDSPFIMYNKVQSFLKGAGDFYSQLKEPLTSFNTHV